MEKKTFNQVLLWISFILIVFAYNMDGTPFFIINAIFVTGITFALKRQNPNSFICYLLFCGSINNLVDEIFFDNTKIGINEYISLICVPLIWYLQKNEKF